MRIQIHSACGSMDENQHLSGLGKRTPAKLHEGQANRPAVIGPVFRHAWPTRTRCQQCETLSPSHPMPGQRHAIPSFIDTTSALDAMLKHLRSQKLIALDVEADSLYHYYPKVCLIQLSAQAEAPEAMADYLVDPLSLTHLEMLGELLAVAAMANQTNRLANGYQIPVDEQFKPGS